MKKISKTTFISMTSILMLVMSQVKAEGIEYNPANYTGKSQTLKRLFCARVIDEKGNEIEGAIGRIKGREDEKIQGYDNRTSGKNKFITFLDPPVNAIIVISKPGYVTKEINTNGLKQPKGWSSEEMRKCIITVKLVSVKEGRKVAGTPKKKV